MRILDLFCGAGGASVGYSRAGHDVVGVDIAPQPDYPFEFIQSDVMKFRAFWAGFDLIHASPPCAAYTAIGKQNRGLGKGATHPRLYEPVRAALEATGKPFVIENPAARPDMILCGESFGLGVIRHRRFELGNWHRATFVTKVHKPHRGRVRGWRHGQYHDGPYLALYGSGGGKPTLTEAQRAMGIDWTNDLYAITQAIPPAYTQFIGEQL